MALSLLVRTIMPCVTGVAQAGIGLGAFSMSTKHMRQFAAMESFFSSLKTERTARTRYHMRDQAKADVFDYIERFYNPVRKHSKLDFLSPVDFEQGLMG